MLFCVEGWDTIILWEGVLVRDLIRAAGINPRATTVIFTANDGYTTSLPFDYVINRDILMAYRMNNVTLRQNVATRSSWLQKTRGGTSGSSGLKKLSSPIMRVTGVTGSSGDTPIPLILRRITLRIKISFPARKFFLFLFIRGSSFRRQESFMSSS